jgi:hypothetical protein
VFTELLNGDAALTDVGAAVGLPISAPCAAVTTPAAIQTAPMVRHPRPELDVAFEAPRDDVGAVLARI